MQGRLAPRYHLACRIWFLRQTRPLVDCCDGLTRPVLLALLLLGVLPEAHR
ncbi:hypothetical protein ART_1053 [Arthrobacter sp. PAMC 25486]|nr:hypothetical protein ART_1053 [Arthrobacter sp. PAMC 25486]